MPGTPRIPTADLLRAVIEAEGSTAEAARLLGCASQNVSQRLERLGVEAPRGTEGRAARVAASHRLLRDLQRPAAPLPSDPARCHPHRGHFSSGLCRECYGERFRRSHEREPRAMTVEEAAIRLQLEGGERASDKEFGMSLTPTQISLLQIMATGTTMKVAAAQLGVSEQTVKNHLTRVYGRIGAGNLVEAFVALGWLRPRPVDDRMILTAQALRLREARKALDEAIESVERIMEQRA